MNSILKQSVSISILLFFLSPPLYAQHSNSTPGYSCFVFIDTHYIWTLEVVETPGNSPIPILNIIAVNKGEWDFRPVQISLVNPEGRIADVKRFSMNTGVEGEPYLTNYLKVLGNSFIGVDLIGDEDQELSQL